MADDYLQNLTEESTWAVDRRCYITDDADSRGKYADQMFALRPAMCRAVLTSDEAISSSTYTTVGWDSTDYDFGGWWSAGSATRLSVPAGINYAQFFFAYRSVADEGNHTWWQTILKNGSPICGSRSNNHHYGLGGAVTTGVVAVTGGTDYFQAEVWADTAFDMESDLAFFSVMGWA